MGKKRELGRADGDLSLSVCNLLLFCGSLDVIIAVIFIIT